MAESVAGTVTEGGEMKASGFRYREPLVKEPRISFTQGLELPCVNYSMYEKYEKP